MNIWIMNHYITNIIDGKVDECRHRYFANELNNRGYNVSLFYSSAVHNSDINTMQNEDAKYKIIKTETENNIVIKTRSYVGNGFSRIENMLDYYNGLLKNYKMFVKELGNPDVVMASSVHPLTCVAGIKIAKKLKVPCIVEIRDLWPLSIVAYKNISNNNIIIKILYALEKWIYKNADSLIFTMPAGKDYIVDKKWEKQVNLDKIFSINNGIDIKLQKMQKQQYQVKDEDLDSNSFKVVYTGSIREANGVYKIVDIANLTKDYDIKYIIYGDGNQREELQEKCKQLNLDNVIFKGFVPKQYTPYICSKADVNLADVNDANAVYKYGLSLNKLISYFNANKPIIVRASGNDLIKKYGCGISVEGDSAYDYKEAILKIYNASKEEYEQMCDGSATAAKDFDFTILVNKLEQAIDFAKNN